LRKWQVAAIPSAGSARVVPGKDREFPKPLGLPEDKDAYLQSVDEIYKSDAYHSLLIEGYTFTLDLIEKVRQGDWDPDHDEEDRKSRDAFPLHAPVLDLRIIAHQTHHHQL
jgi:hypothetical protein